MQALRAERSMQLIFLQCVATPQPPLSELGKHRKIPELRSFRSRPTDTTVSTDDQALIDRCLAGDGEAFGALVDRYQDRLYGTLVHLMGSAHDALDVAQDAFVLAYQNLGSFRGDSAFYSWLFRIAYNASVSFRRRKKQSMSSIEQVREKTGSDPVDQNRSSDPTQSVETTELQRLVTQAVDDLPDDYRTVLILKEMEGLRYDEIAQVVGCPIGTVRSRIHRARSELRDKLSRTLESES